MDDCEDSLIKAIFYSSLDANSGHWQIEIDDEYEMNNVYIASRSLLIYMYTIQTTQGARDIQRHNRHYSIQF